MPLRPFRLAHNPARGQVPSRGLAGTIAVLVLTLHVAGVGAPDGVAQERSGGTPESVIDPSVTLMPPQGKTRVVDFTTDEGTWMSLDVAPDGQWLAFDLLGQIYRMPMSGGRAVCITESSGNALNFHPTISPDGKRIAFISDRQGQNNVWIMDAGGRNPQPVLLDHDTRFIEPAWAPDGGSLIAVRVFDTPGQGWHRQTSELWRLPLDGSAPKRILGKKLTHYEAPTFSRDGRYIYFHISYNMRDGIAMKAAGHRLQRMELGTGKIENVRLPGPADLQPYYDEALRVAGYAETNPVDNPAEVMPVLSPDGKFVAFGLEQRGKAMTFRGHQFTPSTAIAVRNLATGQEKLVLDPAAKDLTTTNLQYAYGALPHFAWLPDGKGLVAWEGGKLRRVELATGEVKTIPFTARVHRVLPEAPRSQVAIDDASFQVKFIQWPSASPDGRHLVFVAVGKIWLMDLPGGTPRPLTVDMAPALQLTPAWSSDGKQIVFATWDDSAQGAVWTVRADAGLPLRVRAVPAEYLYPKWAPGNSAIVVSRGPGTSPDGDWNGWNSLSGWTAIRLPLDGSAASEVASLSGPAMTYFGADGRLYFQYQEASAEAEELLQHPFPSERALSLTIRVRSTNPDGGEPREHLVFPARIGAGSVPALSPTGRWVAFQSGRFVYVLSVPASGGPGTPAQIDPDPNHDVPGRVLASELGGVYQSWRDETTLQFASGNRYITYDAATQQTKAVSIHLQIPRPTPKGAIALVNAKIVTIDGEKVIERGTVVVRGARIECVGSAGQCDAANVDRVVDLAGKFIVPGLFDLHAHHTDDALITPHRSPSALALAYGVTTILDPSTDSQSAFPLAEMIEAGTMVGPRTFSTAEPVISPGTAFGDQKIIRTQADADHEVDRRVDWGAISIKNYRQAGRFQHEFLMRAARRRGVTVTSEGGPLYFDVGLTLEGQTGWEHFVSNFPIYGDAATFFGKAGAVYSPTAIVAGHMAGSEEYFRPRQHLNADAKYRRFMSSAELQARLHGAKMLPKAFFVFPMLAEGVADIVHAGGKAVLGEHGQQYGIGTHWEMWSYAEALTPMEALTVGTIYGAYFAGLDKETGSIIKGKLADLVILNADPLKDIHNSADIAYVMKAGLLYDADTLTEIWPERRPYGPIPWK